MSAVRYRDGGRVDALIRASEDADELAFGDYTYSEEAGVVECYEQGAPLDTKGDIWLLTNGELAAWDDDPQAFLFSLGYGEGDQKYRAIPNDDAER